MSATVKVRVLVAVNHKGEYCAEVWSRLERAEQLWAIRNGAKCLLHDEAANVVWIEADVPLPVDVTIPATVVIEDGEAKAVKPAVVEGAAS